MKQGTYQEPSGVASMTNTPARGKGFADVGKKYQWRPHQLPRSPPIPQREMR
jgi:hypothetical protein